MGTMLEIIENAIIVEPEIEVQADPTQADDVTNESQLAQEIASLWSNHIRLSTDRRVTSKELRQIRVVLAERLAAMKSLLSRPGRGGHWRSWLQERHIPRSTADRLVGRHLEMLCSEKENVLSGAISEPSLEGVGAKLANTVWPDMMNVLNSNEAVVEFIASIAKLSGINHQWRAKGLMIFNAVPEAAAGLPGSTSAPDLASQPSDDASGDTEETTAETAATPTAAGQVAVVADSSDDVV